MDPKLAKAEKDKKDAKDTKDATKATGSASPSHVPSTHTVKKLVLSQVQSKMNETFSVEKNSEFKASPRLTLNFFNGLADKHNNSLNKDWSVLMIFESIT